jgi:ClpP class serine protease
MSGFRIKPQPIGAVLAVDSASGDLAPGSVEAERSGRAAVVRLRGFLADDPDIFEDLDTFGGDVANLEQVIAAIRAADADPDVSLTLLDLSGPGSGADRLAEVMATIRGSKTPTVAWIGTHAYSGFGFMAQAADRVLGSPSATVGSLAVIAGFQPADPESTLEFFSPSRLKREMSAGKLTNQVRVELNKRVAEVDQVLRRQVMVTRGGKITSPERVFSGRSFVGQDAVDAGLIDELHPTMAAALAALTEEDEMKNTPPAMPAGPAITEPAPAGATASAAAEPDDVWYARLGRRLFGGEQAADQAPAATATAPAEPTADPRVEALMAKVAELEARAADADAEAVRAQVRACAALPADAVDPVADVFAACPDPAKRAAAIKKLAAIKSPRLDAAAFADLAPMGYAGGSANLGTGPHAANPAQADAVAAAEAEFKDDPAGLKAALERIHAEGV